MRLGDLEIFEEPGVTWWEDEEHIWEHGQEFRVLHYTAPNCIATILKPVLSPEEYERRRALIEEAGAKLLRSVEERKAREAEAVKGNASGAVVS